MAYVFRKLSAPYGMSYGADRDPSRQKGMPDLTPERDGPIEDCMRKHYPQNLFVEEKDSPLNHWGMGLGGMYCVSTQVRTVIEWLEPGTHQFLDVKLHRGPNTFSYCILKFGRTMDCVDVDKSEVEWATTMVKGKPIKYWMPRPGKPLMIRQQAVSKIHLWQTRSVPDLKFMSDRLHDLLEANGALTGLNCEKQLEI
jgi:hypothetical protein